MKKVININFQGRVIPIEESAYDILKKYTESLSNFFANEEGKEEIINDIEGRIAELFAEILKKGSTCIADDDVNKIINSMGKPEDFETEAGGTNEHQNKFTSENIGPRGRLYRDETDKILGGVCSGIANYLRVDTSIVRIIFALLLFGAGTGFLIYILLWIFVPSKKLKTNITKRLYRNPEEKVIGGVASGLAAYFDISVWIPRLVFAFPLVLGILNSIFHNLFNDFDSFETMIFGSFGGSLTLIYIVLWGVIPEAKTASEKLEMRGSKVDLNSIKNTIQDDLDGFKNKAEKFGNEFSEKSKQWSSEFTNTINEKGEHFTREVNAASKSSSKKFGHVIGILFKAFFLFIAGMIAFALLMALLGIIIGSVSVLPIKNFFLNSYWESVLAWGTIIGFLAIPIIGFIIWLVRRIMKVKSNQKYLGATIGSLWFIGLICCVTLVFQIGRNFKTKSAIEESITIQQPSINKLHIKVANDNNYYYGYDWFGVDCNNENNAFNVINEDSLLMKTIRVTVVKSKDSLYHVKMVKFSRGRNPEFAKTAASNISFNTIQNDSIISLPKGFIITKDDKFRNQQVLFIIEVPQGKKIQIDEAINDYEWFDINFNKRRGWNVNWDRTWDNSLNWDTEVELIMGDKELINPNKNLNDEVDLEESLKDLERKKIELREQQKELKLKHKELLKEQKDELKSKSTNSTIRIKPIQNLSKQICISTILIDKFSI